MQTIRPLLAAISIAGLAACARPTTSASPASPTLRFAAGDSVTVDTVAPGITHYRVIRPSGPFRVQVVTVPVGTRYELIAARANDSLYGRERVTDMVRRRI